MLQMVKNHYNGGWLKITIKPTLFIGTKHEISIINKDDDSIFGAIFSPTTNRWLRKHAPVVRGYVLVISHGYKHLKSTVHVLADVVQEIRVLIADVFELYRC